MKTFNDYINEKHNFIFGGKAGLTGKEYGKGTKTLEELEKGDNVYYFNTWTMKRPDIAAITDISSDKTSTYIALSSKSNGNVRIARVYNGSLDKDCFFRYLQDPGGDFEVISTNKDSFLSELSGRYRRTIDTSLIDEAYNFIFGGKAGLTGKEYRASMTFEELEPGDKLYLYEFDKTLSKTKLVDAYTVTSSLKNDNGTFRMGLRGGFGAHIDKDRINDSIDVAKGSSCYYAYSTYNNDEDVLERAKLYVKEGKYNEDIR